MKYPYNSGYNSVERIEKEILRFAQNDDVMDSRFRGNDKVGVSVFSGMENGVFTEKY